MLDEGASKAARTRRREPGNELRSVVHQSDNFDTIRRGDGESEAGSRRTDKLVMSLLATERTGPSSHVGEER